MNRKFNSTDFFIKNVDGFKCSVVNCGKLLSIRSSTSTLQYHIKSKHANLWEKNIRDDENEKNKNDILHNFPETIESVWAIALATNGISHLTIESPHFIEAITKSQSLNKENIPSRYKIKESVIQNAEIIHSNIIKKFRENKCDVTLCTDGWTNVNKTKIFNLVALESNIPYLMYSLESVYVSNTTEKIIEILRPKIIKLLEEQIRIVAISVDNEASMNSAVNKICAEFPFIIHIPCGAHTFQLCMKHICEHPSISKHVTKAKQIIDIFLKDKTNRIQLRQHQMTSNKQPLKIIDYSNTRWSYIIRSIERLLELKEIISMMTGENDCWEDLKKLCIFLQPFKIATNEIQSDSANLNTKYIV